MSELLRLKKKKLFKERKDSKLPARATTWNSFEVFLISSFPSKRSWAETKVSCENKTSAIAVFKNTSAL